MEPMLGTPSQLIDIHIRCLGLKNLDVMSKSDPAVTLFIKNRDTEQWSKLGRTETIKNNLDPIETTVAEVVTANPEFRKHLQNSKKGIQKNGDIVISCTQIKDLQNEIRLEFSGVKLDKKDLFGKSDPYLIVSQIKPNGQTLPVYQTEVVKNTLDPHWKPFTLALGAFCENDLNRQIVIDCFDWDKNSDPDFIGSVTVPVSVLLAKQSELPLINPTLKKKKGDKYHNSGLLRILHAEIVKNFTFFDFVKSGLQISMVAAIDFTASNGAPNLPQSLHFMNPMQPNDYIQAITTVGNILAYYDSDKMIPVYGFGGKLPSGDVSHCFPLNGNPSNPEVAGIEGVLQAYSTAITTVQLYGPTMFTEILKATQFIAGNAQGLQYFVLLIITDGAINDASSTVDRIVEMVGIPASVVIVGVGNADFSTMNMLDADDSPLRHSSTGEIAKRDLVQFVPFNRFKSNPQDLAKETLAEIPKQVVEFMKLKGIRPNPPPTAASVVVPSAPTNP